MDKLESNVTYIRSTKRMHVYSDGVDGGNSGELFGSLYLPKEALPTDPPNILVITVEELVS